MITPLTRSRRLGVHPRLPVKPRADTEVTWYLYQAWGYLPEELMTPQQRLIEHLFGPQLQLLYVGITCRGGPVRWDEHNGFGEGKYRKPPKIWAQYVKIYELDDSRGFATREAAEAWEAQVINAEQPLGNTAGMGLARNRFRRAPVRTRAWIPVGRRNRPAFWAVSAAVCGYLVLSLPRVTTGAFPESGVEWGAWAALAVALMVWTRYVSARHWMGARSPRR